MARVKGNALLVVAGFSAFVLIYPLVWLHERIGTTSLVVTGLLLAGWPLYKFQVQRGARSRRSAALIKRFEADAIHAMKGRHIRPESVAVLTHRYRSWPWHMGVISHLQVFGESAQLALESKNPETANSRFKVAMHSYQSALESKTELPNSVIWAVLEEIKIHLVDRFPSGWRFNAATALLRQAEGLKTNAAKRKRWLQVVELLSGPEAPQTPELLELRASTMALLVSTEKTPYDR